MLETIISFTSLSLFVINLNSDLVLSFCFQHFNISSGQRGLGDTSPAPRSYKSDVIHLRHLSGLSHIKKPQIRVILPVEF